MLAKRLAFDQVCDVSQASSGVALPSQFLCAPGNYVLNGQAYDMNASGVYVFTDPIAQVWCRRAVTNADPMEMCAAFANMHCHGGNDSAQPFSTLETIARNRRVSTTCGVIAPWAAKWLASAGFRTRVVRFLTTQTPNNYDDGHVAVEIFWNGAWTLADIDLGRYYTLSGAPVSAKDFVSSLPVSNLVTNHLCLASSKLDTAPVATGATFNYPNYDEIAFSTPTLSDQWVNRICQCIGIDAADGNTYWMLPAGKGQAYINWVQGLSSTWKVDTDPNVWSARFY
jgi:hypothetical protein